MDVVFGHQGVGRRQVEEIVVPRFRALELVLGVLGLSLQETGKSSSTQCGVLMRYWRQSTISHVHSWPVHAAEVGWTWCPPRFPEPFAAAAAR